MSTTVADTASPSQLPSVEVANTTGDYSAYCAVTRRRVGLIRYLPLALGAVLSLGALWTLPALLAPHFDPGSPMPLVAGIAAALILWFGSFLALSRVILERSFDRGGTFRETKRFTITDDGFDVETTYSRTQVYWPAVKDVVVTSTHIFVMTDRTIGMIFPKRAFASAAAADAFAAEVKRHIAPKAA